MGADKLDRPLHVEPLKQMAEELSDSHYDAMKGLRHHHLCDKFLLELISRWGFRAIGSCRSELENSLYGAAFAHLKVFRDYARQSLVRRGDRRLW